MLQFGSGYLFGVSNGGNQAANPTPQLFGTLQEVSIDISQTLKELRGNLKFPDDVAPSDMKITGKATFGKLQIDIFNNLFFADTKTTGVKIIKTNEPGTTAIPATPFQLTVANSAQFTTDLGVMFAATGQPLTRVASAPAAGQYSVAAGVYTFNTADTGKTVLMSYVYTSTGGNTLTVNNQLQGYGPSFELWLSQPYQGTNGLHLFACRSSKLGAPLKRTDYQIAEIDFEAFANPAQQVMEWFQVSV